MKTQQMFLEDLRASKGLFTVLNIIVAHSEGKCSIHLHPIMANASLAQKMNLLACIIK